jgi:hypothetical protein
MATPLARPEPVTVTFKPAGPLLGAEVQGLDLRRPLAPEPLAEIRADQGARGCILTDDPGHAPEAEPAEYFMVLSLCGPIPDGRFRFHPAFYA